MSAADLEARYRSRSFWLDSIPEALKPRPALDEDIDVDVAIIGAGYTGLWTAYELMLRDPTLRIAVLESEIAGFGASGRNGGWCSALFAGSRDVTAKAHGRDAAVALQRALFATVDAVGAVAEAEHIEAHFHKGGTLELATAPIHAPRLQARVEEERAWGFGPEDVRWLDPSEAAARLNVAEGYGAVYTPHCARVHPARLVRGLAEAAERRGATIYEQTRVEEISPRRVGTAGGRVKADVVVRATEGYTAQLPQHRRTLAPLYSLMIATEPLPASFWDAVGWGGRETFSDGRHLIIYGQRTADDRIAFGGARRAVPLRKPGARWLRPRSGDLRRAALGPAVTVPGPRGCRDHAPVGWAARRPARLVQLGGLRTDHRIRVGRWLRR